MSYRKVELNLSDDSIGVMPSGDEILNEIKTEDKKDIKLEKNNLINENLIKLIEDIVIKTLDRYGYKRNAEIMNNKIILAKKPIILKTVNKKLKKKPKSSSIKQNKTTKNNIISLKPKKNWVYL